MNDDTYNSTIMADDKFEYLHKAAISAENIAAFEARLNAEANICPATFDDFEDNEMVSEVVRLLGLDAEKFWTLVLFAYDYACDMRSHGIDEEAGGHEMMWALIDRGRCIVNRQPVEPLKADASCTFKLQGRSYKVKDTDSIAVLLYWIHRGMIQAEYTDPIWELNWLIDDYITHQRERTESQSVAIWIFASVLKKFFAAHNGPRTRGNSEVSLNKLLLISRLVFLTRMSDNDNFLFSDDTIKGFMRQYRNFTLPSRAKYYTSMSF